MYPIRVFSSCRAGITALTLAISVALSAGTVGGQQTRPATASAGSRVLHFPTDRSLGTVWIQDANLRREITTFYHWTEDGVSDKWRQLGEAQGDVTIPAGQRVKLMVSREGWKDLSPLAKLAPDDLYELRVEGTGLSHEASEERGLLHTQNAGDSIMPHIAHLTGLKILNLSMTDVTGQGLRHIEQMKSLECLDIPRLTNDGGMTHVAKLTGLKRLYFRENNVTNKGVAKLAALRELEELNLGGTKMDNGALAHLKKLPKLHYLVLWGTTFDDAGMVHLKEVRSLRTFWPFRMSTIGDEGLAHLSSLPNLERISLCHNEKVTDLGMAHVAKMKSLRQLDITHTGIGDVGAEHLQKLKNLEMLEVADGVSRPALVELLATQPHLRRLQYGYMGNCTYGDEALEQVGKMADIEYLYVGGPQVTDAGMAFIAKCRKLKNLTLFYCPITNQGLGEIGKLASLERLEIYGAKLTTGGVAQLNDLAKLEHLHIDEVSPDKVLLDISDLASLRELTLGPPRKGEALRDEDLACLAKLPNLEWLQMPWLRGISDKGLAHLAGLTRMEQLAVGGEGITDAGLVHLANMKSLSLLTISGNLTEKGLMSLQQNPGLRTMTFITPNPLSKDVTKKLMARLPKLIMFTSGRDLQHMSPMNRAAIRKTR